MTNINIRLSEGKDDDIQSEVDKTQYKTARIKELIRKGMKYESTDVKQLKEYVLQLQKEKTDIAYRKSIVHKGDGRKSPIQHLFS